MFRLSRTIARTGETLRSLVSGNVDRPLSAAVGTVGLRTTPSTGRPPPKLSKVSRVNQTQSSDATGRCFWSSDMTRLPTTLTVVIAGLALCSPALAQSAAPITGLEAVGDWRLLITPAEGQGRSVTFRARDGSQRLDFPLAITPHPGGRINCTVSGEPAECRIRDGELRIASASDGFSLIFNLRQRTTSGFTGVADLRVGRLPIGGHIGSVNMTRP